ncbi:MAG: glutamate--tRNA ligase [Vicinamibacterales bacterium]
MIPRVRFAPSPTGYLHVGGARTALFNWLYARHHGGTFVLRIEDTDTDRSSADMVTGILDGLRWLGLDWDEGPEVGGPHAPYFQSARLDRYRAGARQLVDEGKAYRCYCTAERLQGERQAAEARGEGWRYDRACLNLSAAQVAAFEASGTPHVVRFRVPDGPTGFDDAVKGRLDFDGAHIEDLVLLRSDGHPTYHLSVVLDDVDMAITHVIRGDDHISNTPKHVLLFEAFGAAVPRFAHVPLILGADKKRLSKRHGATSVTEYSRLGYLPDAMVNFLALLGWSPGGDREVMTRTELVEHFALDGISGGNAVFDTEKLEWMNGQYIARLPIDELATLVAPELLAAVPDAAIDPRDPWLHQLLELLRPRARRLTDFAEQARPFLVATVSYDEEAVQKHLAAPDIAAHVAALVEPLRTHEPFDEAGVEALVRATAAAQGIKAGALIHAVRVAVVGRANSPGLFEVLVLLGRERTVDRLERLLTFLSSRT